MPNLSNSSPSSNPRHPSREVRNEVIPSSKQDVKQTASFVARVRETLVNNNTSNEFEKVIAVKQRNHAAFLVTQRTPRVGNESEPKCAYGAISEYPVDNCVKITSPWSTVERLTSMAIQFEKVDSKLPDVKWNRFARGTKNRKSVPKNGRTKVMVLHIRNWTQESAMSVRQIWGICHEAAAKYRQEHKAELSEDGSRISIPGMPTSVVDEKTRVRERNRVSSEYALLPRISRAAGARQTQGQKMLAAMAASSARRPSKGCYSALSRGVSGEKSYAKSLIGSPSFKNIDTKPETKCPQAPAPGRHIEEVLDRRSGKSQSADTSVFTSPRGPTEMEKAPSPAVSRKRVCANQDNLERQSKRQRFMSQQLKLHMESAQVVPRRKRLHSFVRSPPATAGIVNEGNTCYLSAVVQALMNDSLLISALRKCVVADIELSFSSALISMANDRDSSTTLKAGKIRAAISKHFPEFSSSVQQDVHEFFLRCLDVVASECTFHDFRMSPAHVYYSLVQERIFKCTSCGHSAKPKREILRGLSLDIPHADLNADSDISSTLSVKDLVNNFFAPQELDLNCERCSSKKARSDSKIIVPPRILVVHIKRFGVQYDTDNGSVSLHKISAPIQILKRLSLDSVLSSDALSPHVIEESAKSSVITNPVPHQVTPTRIDDPTALCTSGTNFKTSDLIASPENRKSQAPAQKSQLFSHSDSRTENPRCSRPSNEPFNFARRFRIHADEPCKNRNNQGVHVKTLTKQRVNRRLELDDDKVEDDTIGSPTHAVNEMRRFQDLSKILALGLPKHEAEEILRRANYDVTHAVGMALDRRQEVLENPADLDSNLLKHIHSFQNTEVAPCDKANEAHYNLAAVIRHHSNSVENGHYVVDILQPDGSWFCYDDSNVFQLNSRALQDEEGYLCWYALYE